MPALALLFALTVDTGGHWYNRKACEAFPDHECRWDWTSTKRCSLEPDDPTACVEMTHPSVWDDAPNRFAAVFDREGLVSMAVYLSHGPFQFYVRP